MSLRDVERAMIVLIYFYEKMHLFRRLIDQKKVKRVVYKFLSKLCIHLHCLGR